jgi:hypothetical protein
MDVISSSQGGIVIDRLLERKPSPADIEEIKDSKIVSKMVSPELTLQDIPPKYRAKVELAVDAMMNAVAAEVIAYHSLL